MKKIIELIKRQDTLWNVFFSAFTALSLCFLLYNILLPVLPYYNLNDFYAGITIYDNYNKYLTIFLFLFYIVSFYIIFLFNRIKIPVFKFNIEKYKMFIFIVLGIIFLLFLARYIINFSLPAIPDDHHYGEKFAAYFAHTKFRMNYYSDIMLVHGYSDILPSWFADKILGNLTIANERLATYIFKLIFLCTNIVLSSLIFKKDLLTILITSNIFTFILPAPLEIHFITIALFYIFLIQYLDKLNPVLWFSLYYTGTAFLAMYQTTIGISCFAASLPVLALQIKNQKRVGLITLGIFAILIYVLLGGDITAFLDKAGYYAASNLYSFGNNFQQIVNPYKFIIGTFAFLAFPVFLYKVFLIKNKKIKLALIFTLITTAAIANYAFGRIDEKNYIPRALNWSLAVLTVIIPYLAYKLKKDCLFTINIIIISALIIFSVWVSPACIRHFFGSKVSNTRINEKQDIKNSYYNFIKKMTAQDDLYLDLNNAGMNYYYTQRKPAMPYTSFYNIVNTTQTEEILANLKKNPPKIVFLYAPEIFTGYDYISITQRINKIYRWLFLSGLYEFVDYNGGYFLIYTPQKLNKIHTLKADAISQNNLHYLPDVWGASIRTLPMKPVNADLSVDGSTINIKNGISPKNADLLYIEYEAESEVCVNMYINALLAKLEVHSKRPRILIPLDNYPSWLLEDKISQIFLDTDKPIKIKKAKLYKRN